MKRFAELDLPAGASLVLVQNPSPQNNSINSLNVSVRLTLTIKLSCPCYGLAENALAVSFSDEASGVVVNEVDRDIPEYQGKAVAPGAETRAVSTFVNCGKALPEHGIEIRNEAGMPVAERVEAIFASPVPV